MFHNNITCLCKIKFSDNLKLQKTKFICRDYRWLAVNLINKQINKQFYMFLFYFYKLKTRFLRQVNVWIYLLSVTVHNPLTDLSQLLFVIYHPQILLLHYLAHCLLWSLPHLLENLRSPHKNTKQACGLRRTSHNMACTSVNQPS